MSGSRGMLFNRPRARAQRCTRAAGTALALLGAVSCGGINVVHKQELELQAVNLPLRTFAFPSGLRVIVEKGRADAARRSLRRRRERLVERPRSPRRITGPTT